MPLDELEVATLLAPLAETLPALHDALIAADGRAFDQVELAEGETLIEEGAVPRAMHVIVSGALRASVLEPDGSEVILSEFGPGSLAGELAVLTGGAHSARVAAAEDSVLVRVPKKAFEEIVRESPGVLGEMAEGVRMRVLRGQLATGLGRLFGHVDGAMLAFVEERIEWVRIRAGMRLFRAGDPGDDLYFVLGGRLRATSSDGSVLGEMVRGESIGEMAVLTGEPRTADVTAVRDSEMVRVSREAFDEIVAKYPGVMRRIARVVVDRLRRKERADPVRRLGKCVAIVAAGSGSPIDSFTERLVGALEGVGATLHLSAGRLEALLDRPGVAHSDEDDAEGIRLTAWLDEEEATHRFLVYETDGSDSPWTRRCLRQADEVLLVAPAGSPPGPAGPEVVAGESSTMARHTLVLTHPGGDRLPTGTPRWFEGRELSRVFHVRLDGEGDFRRLARCLGDAATGLVLGGGGARGLAHIGVLRALVEANVAIDRIGGTSMGAVVSGLFAMGCDWREMTEINRDGWMRQKVHKEYSLPLISIIRSRRIDKMAQNVWGEVCIEDLWTPWFSVSANLTTSSVRIHERGPVWKAVRASASLPAVFVPVLEGGDVLVDGGIVNNLPGDVMRERSCGKVVVVDVGAEKEFTVKEDAFPSPWQYLASRLFPRRRKIDVPHIVDVVMRTTEVSSAGQTLRAKREADISMRPPIDRFSLLGFEQLDEIVETGYRYAMERLEAGEFEGVPTS